MLWISLIGLATLVSAGNSVLDKRLVKTPTINPLMCAASAGVVCIPIAVVGILLLPPIPWLAVLEAVGAGLLYLPAVWLYYMLVCEEDISNIVPLLRMTSVQTLIGGVVFLGDRLNAREYVAFVALLVCSVLLSMRANGNGRLSIGRAMIRSLPITTLLAGDNLLLDLAYQNPSVTLWHGQVWQSAGTGIGLIGAWIVIRLQRRSLSTAIDRYGWGVLLAEQAIRTLTGLAPAWAMTQHVPVALISAASGLTPLFVWILAVVLLRERSRGYEVFLKSIGMLGIVVAMFLLT